MPGHDNVLLGKSFRKQRRILSRQSSRPSKSSCGDVNVIRINSFDDITYTLPVTRYVDVADDTSRPVLLDLAVQSASDLVTSIECADDARRRDKRLRSKPQEPSRQELPVLDLHSPASIVGKIGNVRKIINKDNLTALPVNSQVSLIGLLPDVDSDVSFVQDDPYLVLRLGHGALNNVFFSKGCEVWQDRLARGHLLPPVVRKVRSIESRDAARIDPWKIRNFESTWGENDASSNNVAASSSSLRNITNRPDTERSIGRLRMTRSRLQRLNARLEAIDHIISERTSQFLNADENMMTDAVVESSSPPDIQREDIPTISLSETQHSTLDLPHSGDIIETQSDMLTNQSGNSADTKSDQHILSGVSTSGACNKHTVRMVRIIGKVENGRLVMLNGNQSPVSRSVTTGTMVPSTVLHPVEQSPVQNTNPTLPGTQYMLVRRPDGIQALAMPQYDVVSDTRSVSADSTVSCSSSTGTSVGQTFATNCFSQSWLRPGSRQGEPIDCQTAALAICYTCGKFCHRCCSATSENRVQPVCIECTGR